MLQKIFSMLGGAARQSNIDQTNLEATADGVIIFDLQSVITFGTTGKLIKRNNSHDYIINLFSAMDTLSSAMNIKIYIISDELSVSKLNNLIPSLNVSNLFEENNNYFIARGISNKSKALETILNKYKMWLSGPIGKKIVYFSRLYTSNPSNEMQHYKKLSQSIGPQQGVFKPHLVDNPAKYSSANKSQHAVIDRMYRNKSIKELMYPHNPLYNEPFIMNNEHFKSMMRHLDPTSTILQNATSTDEIVNAIAELLI